MNRLAAGLMVATAWPMLTAFSVLGPPAAQPATTRLPAAYEASAGAVGEAATSAPSLAAWWTAYDDPQLTALVERALAGAPSIQAARARLDEAVAIRGGALARYDPQGALGGSVARAQSTALSGNQSVDIPGLGPVSLTGAGSYTQYGANFDVSWEIDLFGRRGVARRGADADLAAARFASAATRASLAAAVADALFQARGLEIQRQDAGEIVRIDASLAEAARGRALAGIGSQGDARLASAVLNQARARADDLAAQAAVARRTLLSLLGLGTDPLASLAVDAALPAAPALPASLPGDLLLRRPDVLETGAILTSKNAGLKLDELAQLPTIAVQPQAALAHGASALGGPVTLATLGVGAALQQPVFDLPRIRAEVRAQHARAEQAAIAYADTLQNAYAEVDSALMQLRADALRVQQLTAAEADARWAFEAQQSQYAAGAADLPSTLVAEQVWRAARLDLAAARVARLRRSVQLFKALGGGWPGAST